MDFSSISIAAPIFTGVAALIVGGVTRWTQRQVARDRIVWEAQLELVKAEAVRFKDAMNYLIEAANAANRYILRSPDFDVTDYDRRESYILPILDAAGRARIEFASLPQFDGREEVAKAIKCLETLVEPPPDATSLRKRWAPKVIDTGITSLSRAQSIHMRSISPGKRSRPALTRLGKKRNHESNPLGQ